MHPVVAMALLVLSASKPRLLGTELGVSGGIDAKVSESFSELVANEVERRGFFQGVSAHELQALIGVERQRQTLGCSSEATSCLQELSGAAGARFVVSGTLVKLGEAFQLNIQMLDSDTARTQGRSTRLPATLVALREQIPFAVAEATGTPLPPAPSRLLPYSLMAGGALLAVMGTAAGLDGLARDRTMLDEIHRGDMGTAPLAAAADYRQTASLSRSRRRWASPRSPPAPW